ncbi:MAG: two-component system response regulator [Spirochaetae bacterium HGW-Spirochaetae-1]|nr:MAG: two-component system response regulator [Spirochaetae bacterium HGW-Spirochaetae-1]
MGKTIMIIDDATSIRQVVAMTLEEAGYEYIEAKDGVDALNQLDGRQVDMFICDVNMPNMDGVTFLEKVKHDDSYSSYRFTPFIMLTTESGADMKAKGKDLGAKAWMVKPFQPEQLLGAVKKLII